MKLSKNGLSLIKNFESLRLKAYKPVKTEKYYTIGYGHCGKDVKYGDKITVKKAESLLEHDIDRFEKAVNDYVSVTLNQNQYDALVSFAFNIGIGAFKDSTLLKKLNQKDYKGASDQFPRWNKSGGKVLAGLVKRREMEQELFNKAVKKRTVKSVKVKTGDTLSAIAQKYNTTIHALLKLNPSIENPDLIYVGQTIKLSS